MQVVFQYDPGMQAETLGLQIPQAVEKEGDGVWSGEYRNPVQYRAGHEVGLFGVGDFVAISAHF
jgi:hypothetical protein